MINEEKKTVFLKGSVQFPLKVGARAIIYHADRSTWTSAVELIHQVSEDLIVFETRNSTYCIALKNAPLPSAVYLQPAMCA